MKNFYQPRRFQLGSYGFLLNTLLFLGFIILQIQNIYAQTPLKQESGSLTTANGTSTVPQVVTYFDGAAAYSPTTTVTYSFSNQQYGTGTAKPLEGMATLPGLLFGGNSTGASNSAPAGFPRNSLMNGISSPLDSYFKACAACATGSIQVANDYAVGLQSLTDGFINSSGTNIVALNSKVYMGDLTITFNRPVSNPIFQFVGMGGFMNYFIDHGFPSGIRNYDMGWASEFELVGSDVTLSKVFGNAQLTVTGNEILNNATSLGNSSAGAALNGVTRYAASGSILASGSNITSITLKVYLRGDGGRITNSSGIVASGVDGRTPQWSLAPFHPTSTSGTVNSDVYLIGVTLQKPVSLSGNVFKDVNAGNVDNSTGVANLVPAGMSINLLDADGIVVATVPVATNGTYTIPAIFEGTYTTSLSTIAGTVGMPAPAPSNPASWSNTGEFTGTPNTGTDAAVNGISAPFTVAATNISNINFGIKPSDKDADGIDDVTDLDDDNDGILDSVENPNCNTWVNTTGLVVTNPRGPVLTGTGATLDGVPMSITMTEGGAGSLGNNAGGPGLAQSSTALPFTNAAVYTPAAPGTINRFQFATDINNSTAAADFIDVVINFDQPVYHLTMQFDNLDFNRILFTGNHTERKVSGGTQFTLNASRQLFDNASTTVSDPTRDGYGSILMNEGGAITQIKYRYYDDPNSASQVDGHIISFSGCASLQDTDKDGIPNYCDLDSDGDGCPDAIEGGSASITSANLVNSTLPGGNTGAGYIGTSSTPVIQNLGNSVGATGIPNIAGPGQNVGNSLNPSVNDCVVNVSGNVFNDPNGLNVDNSSGATNLVPAGMFASLVDNATGKVVQSVPVNVDGTYTIPGVYEGNYKVVLSITNAATGDTPPAPALPDSWTRTGDFNGTPNTGNSAPNDGISANFAVTTTDIPNVNFAIQQIPETAVNLQPSMVNPGGTTQVIVPASAFQTSNVGANPNTDDPTTIGTVTQMKIPTFPTGATSITVGGTTYLSTDPIWGTGGITVPYTDGVGPTPAISVDPISGAGSVVIPIIAIDNLGNPDPTPGSVTIPFTVVTVEGNVFNDPNATNVNNSTGVPNLVPAGMKAVLVDNATGFVVANTTVGTDGVYNFGNVDSGNYKVVISTTDGTIGSMPPTPSIPAGWLKTGDFTGAPDTGNTLPNDGISANFAVTNANITNVNFAIQQPPTANIVTLPISPNPGGTIPTSITSSFGGDDPEVAGIISAVKITSFPTNATSITIGGVPYTTLMAIQAAYPNGIPTNAAGVPSVGVSVDPIDGAVTVKVPYVTIDNAGAESPIPGEINVPFSTVNVSGNVYNDITGLTDNTVNGAGIGLPSGTPLHANLLNSSGAVVATTPVNSDGTYEFANVSPGSYSVSIGTTPNSTSTTLPAGWLNTGENNSTGTGSDGTINGISAPFSVLSTDITNVNFGIEQPPTAKIVTLASTPNPGGTVNSPNLATSFGGTDPDGGIITALKITSFPTNATSITIGGVPYTTLMAIQTAYPNGIPTSPTGVPSTSIAVDPIDGATTVNIPYVTIDNAGVESPIPGVVNVPFTTVNVSGNVFNDITGLKDNTVNGTGIGLPSGTQLHANLLNSSGTVVATTPINPDGTYNFTNVTPGNYSVSIGTTANSTSTALPAGWLNTGENNSPGAGSDGTINGTSAVFSVLATDIPNINFGIEQPPTAKVVTLPITANPGGTVNSPNLASSFGGADPDGGIITALKITSFPANATSITIGGVPYTTLIAIQVAYPNGIPTSATGVPTTSIVVDPIDGAVTVNIPYVTIDNAGVESPIPGAVNVPYSTVNVSGSVFNDINGLKDSEVNGTGIGLPSGTQLHANLLNSAGGVVATTPINADGTYNFPNVTPGTYSVSIGTTLNSTSTTLPAGWLNTGENNSTGPGSDGIVNGTSAQFAVLTTDIPNINFGIEQPPTANVETLATSPNPGGTVNSGNLASSFGGADPDGGIVTALKITAFPTNATSITIGGTPYTTLAAIQAAFPNGIPTNAAGVPNTSISVDPIDGNVTVSIPYKTIDNAGVESPIPGAVNVPFSVVNVSGNVFNDLNGLKDNTVNGTGIGLPSGTQLHANLLNSAGAVVATTPINSDGTYNFPNVSPGSYSVSIGTTPNSTSTTLPANWVNTGENNETSAGSDGTINGKSSVFAVNSTDVPNINFGIEQLPAAKDLVASIVINPGGSVSETVSPTTFGGTDPDGGTVDKIRITAIPIGATTITIDGTTYGPGFTAFPPTGVIVPAPGGIPSVPILVDPTATGTTNVVIPYVTIDNAGFESPIPGSATVPFKGLNVTGNVYNDPNAGFVNNSTGAANSVPSGMTAYLIKDGIVVALSPVAADGTYSILDQPAGIGYSVVLTTSTAAPGDPTPTITTPTGFIKTGEYTGTPNTGNDGVVDSKSAPFDLVATDQPNVNFAIQEPPTANIVDLGTELNPGGTLTKDFTSSFGGTDPSGGIISSLTITSLPANITSITINGIKYGPMDTPFPMGGVNTPTNAAGIPISPILIDPIDGITNVVVPYVTIDNGGATSPIPGEVKIGFTVISVSGNVFNDPDALNVNNSSGDPNTVPSGIVAYLVKAGVVVGAGVPVAADGSFTFGDVAPGTGYTVVISNTPPVSTTPPVVTLPTGWNNTGEFNGIENTGTDATVNGTSAPFDVIDNNILDRNFGIQQPPTANIVDLGTVPNPGGTTPKDVTSSFGGTDPTTNGIIESITITSLPPNVTSITINGTPYGNCPTCTAFPPAGVNTPTDANGVPTSPILVDPVDGDVVVTIPYVTIDNGGVTSPIPGEVKVAFDAISVTGNVFNDPNAGNVNNSSGEPANVVPTGMTAYLVKDGAVVGAGAPVGTDGTFSFGTVPPGNGYTVVLSTNPLVGTTPPAPALPLGWLNTGEFNGAPDGGTDATVNGTSASFDVVGTDVVNRNFGIQEPPTANIVDLGTVPNPGGTTPKDVTSSFGGTDPTTNGIISSITITSLPPNVTSITINGIKYGTCPTCTVFPPTGVNTPTDASGVPSSPILIDPIDGDVVVTIPYVTIDNAGVPSPIPGEVKVAFEGCLLEIGGIIYKDITTSSDGVNGTAVNGTTLGLYMTLVQGTTIIDKQAISAEDGSYKFTGVQPGTYSLVLTTNVNGSITPSLPASYISISEGGASTVGGTSAGDGTSNGKTQIIVDCAGIQYELPPVPLRLAAPNGINATASYLDNDFGINNPGALPVDLVDFSGKQIEDQINLTWKTANEKDFSHFEVQRSADVKEFGSIGKVNGNKSSIYNLADTNPIEGTNYYRLKMVDVDGTSKLSNTISVNFEKGGSYVSVENPAVNGEFKVMTNLKNAKFILLNNLGQKVDFEMNNGNNSLFIMKVKNPVSGMYYLNIESEGKFKTKKLIMP